MGKLFDSKTLQGQSVDESLIAKFAGGGVHFLKEKTLRQVIHSRITSKTNPTDYQELLKSFCTVEVDLAMPAEFEKAPDFSLRVSNITTGREVLFTDFRIGSVGEQKVLTFNASMYIPEAVVNATVGVSPDRQLIGLSFLDLCYGGAAELQALETDTVTPARDGVAYADIGWVLSSRFVDTFVDALGKLNDTMFEGALRESMIYTRG